LDPSSPLPPPFRSLFLFAAGLLVLPGATLRAEQPPANPPKPAAPGPAVTPRGIKLANAPLLVQSDEPGLPFGMSSSTSSSTGDAEGAGNEWVFAPVPFSNSLLGFGLAVGVAYIYHLPGEDLKLPPWTTGVGAFYSENDSWGAMIGHKMNLRDDTWRLTGMGGYGQVNYDFYGVDDTRSDPQFVSLHQTVLGLNTEGLVRVKDHFYLGLNYSLAEIETRIAGSSLPPWINDILTRGQLSSVLSLPSLRVQWDTRDNTFLPTRGWLVDGEAMFSDTSLGSDFTFQVLSFHAKHYWKLSDRQTLAVFGFGRFAYGDVPFFELSMIGAKGNLRGYSVGRYQDNMALTGQVEYRQQLSRRFGLVAFGGVGAVAPDLEGFRHATTLPSVGAGLRYALTEKNQVNMRLDVAWGKDEHLIYLGVGEAF